jgi:hypothetical protein
MNVRIDQATLRAGTSCRKASGEGGRAGKALKSAQAAGAVLAV